MDLNIYITNNYYEMRQIVKNIVKKDDDYLIDELFHYCLHILLEKPKKLTKALAVKNQVNFYFSTIILNQYKSSTSPFYRSHRNFEYDEIMLNNLTNDEEYIEDDKMEYVLAELEEQDYYTKKMVELKFDENMSYREISKLTHIPTTSCWLTIDKFRKEILENYRKEKYKQNGSK